MTAIEYLWILRNGEDVFLFVLAVVVGILVIAMYERWRGCVEEAKK